MDTFDTIWSKLSVSQSMILFGLIHQTQSMVQYLLVQKLSKFGPVFVDTSNSPKTTTLLGKNHSDVPWQTQNYSPLYELLNKDLKTVI